MALLSVITSEEAQGTIWYELGSAVCKISFLYTALYAVPAIYFLCYKISSGIVIREKNYFLQSRVDDYWKFPATLMSIKRLVY